MKYKFITNLIIYVLLCIVFWFNFKQLSGIFGEGVLLGLFFMVTGIWGLIIEDFLLRVFYLVNYKKQLNIILIVIGVGFVIYDLIY